MICGKLQGMSVKEIESLIEELSTEERDEIALHLEELRAREWDEQIERDAKSGKLDALAEKATANFAAGRFTEL